MADVRDVASYILHREGRMSAMKLQKLVYYAQAWHLTWEGGELFNDEVQAWKQGPVVYRLWKAHRGLFNVRRVSGGDATAVPADQAAVVDAVLDFYGKKGGDALGQLTHEEHPWRKARGSLPDSASSNAEITRASMRRFYTRKSMSGASTPTRPVSSTTIDDATLLAEADRQIKRWQHTLDWLAAR